MSVALAERDWRCQACNTLVQARFQSCRNCGETKPVNADIGAAIAEQEHDRQMALVPLAPAESPIIRELTKGDEWQCPLCKQISFSNRTTCKTCGCPRPEGPTVVNAVQHQLAQGGYIGYLPDPSKVQATSSWCQQWDSGPPPTTMSLSSLMLTESIKDAETSSSASPTSDYSSSSDSDSDSGEGSSSSSSSSSSKEKKKKKKETKKENKTDNEKAKSKGTKPSKSKGAKTDGTAKGKVKKNGKADPKAKAKAKAGDKAKKDKKKKKVMTVEEELEKRRLQSERRKARIVELP